MTANSQSQAWPIYSLCSYENSGSLLDLYMAIFSPTPSQASAKTKKQRLKEHNKHNEDGINTTTTNNNTTDHGNNLNNHHLTTSDYLTAEETQSSEGKWKKEDGGIEREAPSIGSSRKGRRKRSPMRREGRDGYAGLRWWQLIECDQKTVVAVDSYRIQVLQFCSRLHSAISSFLLSPSSHISDQPTQDQLTTTISKPLAQLSALDGDWHQLLSSLRHQHQVVEKRELLNTLNASQHDHSSAVSITNKHLQRSTSASNVQEQSRTLPPVVLSPTKLRRLSWRRKVLHQIQPSAALGRRLVAGGGTYSLNEQCSSPTSNQRKNLDEERNKHGGVKQGSLLEAWLQESPEHRALLSATRASGAQWANCRRRRGKFGESLAHILIVNQTNAHLTILVILFQLYPKLMVDIFESAKFAGLNCLHLSIAYSNERLLRHMIVSAKKFSLLPKLVDQRVTGSLFKSPIQVLSCGAEKEKVVEERKKGGVSSHSKRWPFNTVNTCNSVYPELQVDHSDKEYWCDQMDHWPTANGRAHLLLFDRVLARAELSKMSAAQPQPQLNANELGNAKASTDDHTLSYSEASTPIYLGDTPLSWSVSFNARSMYELLVELGGANQNTQDSQGNGCLHQLVINDQVGWTRFLVKSGASASLKNKAQLTPLLFACHLGRVKLFNELLELSAVEFWAYSMVRCCGYPLTSLDSLLIKSNPSANLPEREQERSALPDPPSQDRVGVSAMSVILESTVSDNEQKAQLLSSAVVKKLLEEKWRIFARRLFYHELFLSLVHLFLMTLAISLRPLVGLERYHQTQTQTQTQSTTGLSEQLATSTGGGSSLDHDWRTFIWLERLKLIRYLSELSTVLLSARQLIRFGNEWRRYGNVSLQWTYNPLLPNFVAANSLIVLCAVVRLLALASTRQWSVLSSSASHHQLTIGLARAEEVMLIFAAPLHWSSLLFFIAAFRVTGPFVAMIRYMIVRDLRQFSLIYLVFLYSFAQCIFFVNRPTSSSETRTRPNNNNNNNNNDTQHSFLGQLVVSYVELCMDLFKMTLGVYDLQPYRHSTLARLFFLLFLYLIPILFNMLIAMMNNTYSLIISQSERAWSFQWARTLFALERRLAERDKSHYLRLYSINMVAPSDGDQKHDELEGEEDGIAETSKRFVPALMIIKRMSYTRAERRRLVVGYWQKSIRSILSSSARMGAPSVG